MCNLIFLVLDYSTTNEQHTHSNMHTILEKLIQKKLYYKKLFKKVNKQYAAKEWKQTGLEDFIQHIQQKSVNISIPILFA